MISGSDQPGKSVAAIYAIWKRKKTKTHFPAIPGDLEAALLSLYLNEWLFKTGYIKDWEYDAEYALAEDLGHTGWTVLLDEIFSGETVDAQR